MSEIRNSASGTRSHRRRARPVSLAIFALCAALALVLSACGGGSSAGNPGGQSIKVGAYAFPEGQLLANLYADALNKAGFNASIVPTESRETGQPALSQGALDVTVEYTSSLLNYFKANSSTTNDAANLAMLQSLANGKNVTVLDPAPATDNYAFGVSTAFVQQHSITTLSQLAAYSQSNPVVVAGIQSCKDRPYCLAGLESVYGLKVANFQVTVLSSQASVDLLTNNKAQLVEFDSSDGILAGAPVTILKDDKGLNSNDYVIPTVNTKVVSPNLSKALNGVSAKLTQDLLNNANKKVQVDRQPAADVASGLLAKLGG